MTSSPRGIKNQGTSLYQGSNAEWWAKQKAHILYCSPRSKPFFFFFLKQEESWWLERTKKGFKSADIGAGWSWVGPGVGPYSGMSGVFGHPQGQGGYRCLENREASGTAHEDNNHQIPATQLQRCLYTGLLWGPERMAAVCPGCACPDWTGAVLSYSQCVPSTGPISGMQQKSV